MTDTAIGDAPRAARTVRPALHSPSIGHYSPGVEVDCGTKRLLFISGQVATGPDGSTVGVADPRAQSHQVFENLAAVLRAAGALPSDVVSMTVFVTDRAHFPAVNEVRNEFFRTEPYPSSTLVIVAGLAVADHLVEVNAVAVLDRCGT